MNALVLAGSCFPNCHPAGQHVDGMQASGNLALGAAVVCVLLIVIMTLRGK